MIQVMTYMFVDRCNIFETRRREEEVEKGGGLSDKQLVGSSFTL